MSLFHRESDLTAAPRSSRARFPAPRAQALLVAVALGVLSAACGSASSGDADSSGTSDDENKAGTGNTPNTGAGGGASGGAGTAAAGAPSVAPNPTLPPGKVWLKPLNVAEYKTTILDWLGITVAASELPGDQTVDGFDTISEALRVSQVHIIGYASIAQSIIETLFTTDPGQVRTGWCGYTSADEVANQACAASIVSNFAEKAWRRSHESWPAQNDGIETYLAILAADGVFKDAPLGQRLQIALQAVLQSPRFVLRLELADANGQLDGPSVAARLSYMLWSSAPDNALLESNLLDDTVLLEQLQRLQGSAAAAAESSKFERFLQRFPEQWLGLNHLNNAAPDPRLFPMFTSDLADAMRRQTLDMFRGFAGPGANAALPFRQILTQPAPPPVYAALADLYGTSPRSGLLTQASILNVTSWNSRPSMSQRAVWVMSRVLCSPPLPPPAETAPPLLTDQELALTEREMLEVFTASPQCATCHATMNPIGFALQNYDAIGAYRTVDSKGYPIDASGTLADTGESFSDAIELSSILAEDPRVSRCITQKLLTYGTGRRYTDADEALLDAVTASAGGQDATFASTLEAVVLSSAFRRTEGDAP